MIESNYPKISIIIPCFDMERYIEFTLKSIINQNYLNLEIIIIDGGSNDNTLKIVNNYKPYIHLIISEKDQGQYDAIQKGFKIASGTILCWLNADDISFPWSLHTVAKVFTNKNVKWLTGIPAYLNEDGSIKKIYSELSAKPNKFIRNGWFRKNGFGYLQQESMFWTKEVWDISTGLNLNYSLAADFDLWVRFSKITDLWTINLPLSAFRIREGSRSAKLSDVYEDEVFTICSTLPSLPFFLKYFGKHTILNFLIRLLTLKKSKIIYQKFNDNNLTFTERVRSTSALSFTNLLLEI